MDPNIYDYDSFIDFYDLEECELEQERDDDFDYHFEKNLEERKVERVLEPAGPRS